MKSKKVEDVMNQKKRDEMSHRETVMDLNGKLNEKEVTLTQ